MTEKKQDLVDLGIQMMIAHMRGESLDSVLKPKQEPANLTTVESADTVETMTTKEGSDATEQK